MSEVKQLLADMDERLRYVLTTKENAVQQTLSDTEASLGLLGELKALVALSRDVESSHARVLGIDVEGKFALLVDQIQQHLISVLTTQGYQDLTGQVLKRVMEDIAALSEVDMSATISSSRTDEIGHGPSALKREKEERSSSQEDIDDLLSDLGI